MYRRRGTEDRLIEKYLLQWIKRRTILAHGEAGSLWGVFRKESEKIRGTCLDITLRKVMQRRAKSK